MINLIEYQEVHMKRTSSKVIVILLALTFVATASAAFAQGICPSAKITGSIESMISRGYCLFVAGKFKEAQEEFEKVLAKDPGNPVALNDLAAVMVKENKLDKADTYLQRLCLRPRVTTFMSTGSALSRISASPSNLINVAPAVKAPIRIWVN